MNYTSHKIRELKVLPPSQIYLVHWGDRLLAGEILRRIRSEYLREELRDFNFTKFEFTRLDKVDRLLGTAEELPLMAEKRLIQIEGAQSLALSEKKRLAACLRNLPKSTVVVLAVENPEDRPKKGKDRPHISKDVDDLVSKEGVTIDCNLQAGEMEKRLKENFKSLGKEVKPEVLHLIEERAGINLSILGNEMEKLTLYTLGRKEIRRKDIEAVVTRYPNAKIFDLGTSLSRRDTGKSLRILHELLEEEGGEEKLTRMKGAALKLIGYINSYYRQIATMQGLREKNYSVSQMARELRMHPYRAEKLWEESAGITADQLSAIFNLLLRADLGVKQGKDPRLILEILILQICKGK